MFVWLFLYHSLTHAFGNEDEWLVCVYLITVAIFGKSAATCALVFCFLVFVCMCVTALEPAVILDINQIMTVVSWSITTVGPAQRDRGNHNNCNQTTQMMFHGKIALVSWRSLVFRSLHAIRIRNFLERDKPSQWPYSKFLFRQSCVCSLCGKAWIDSGKRHLWLQSQLPYSNPYQQYCSIQSGLSKHSYHIRK